MTASAEWASVAAHDGVLARGFEINNSGWRNIFLAITDTVLGEPAQYSTFRVELVGPVRQGERWAVRWRSRSFDVIYNPYRALIERVIDHRQDPEGAAATAPAPKGLSPAGAAAFAERSARDERKGGRPSFASGSSR